MNKAAKPHIQCHDVFKIYKRADLEVVALRGLDLEVLKGDLIAIVGDSGSGKTTLLNILAGLEVPSAGHLSVSGKDLLTMSNRDRITYRRLDVGFIWQMPSRNLIDYMSILDNVCLPMFIVGGKQSTIRRRAADLLDSLGLQDKLNAHPEHLSGGEQQRAAIAVALANQPTLILADEPTGELDTETSDNVFNLLHQINKTTGSTIVIVTHDNSVSKHVSRVARIRDGRISSERRVESTFQRKGETVERDYVVIDRAGRLQLPQGYAEHLQPGNLANVEIRGDHIAIQGKDQSTH